MNMRKLSMCSSLTHLGPLYILTHEAEHGVEVTVAAFAGCIFWVGCLASPIRGGLSHTLVTHDCSSLTTALCVESYYFYFFKEEIKAPRHSVSKCQGLMLSECVWTNPKFPWSLSLAEGSWDACLQFHQLTTRGQACLYWDLGISIV